jgi:hypothetical protein
MEKYKTNVEAPTPVLSLSEIMQNNLTQFALARYDDAKDKLIQCHQFVKCRDFMLDVFVGMEENKDMEIYGFKFLKSFPRPDAENTSLLLRLVDARGLKNFQENFPILTEIENKLGWGTSFPDLVDYPDGKSVVVWVAGDKRWQRCAVAFSLYTYILKCLTYPIVDKSKWMEEIRAMPASVEARYMNIEHISFLLKNMNHIITKYSNFSGWKNQKETNIGTVHNNSGFVSVAKYFSGQMPTHVLCGYKEESLCAA